MKTAITPGEILLEDYLVPMGISQNALARALGISPRSVNEIVLGRRSITPEMPLKLGKFFKQSAQFWFNIQTTCDFRQLLKKANHRRCHQRLYQVGGLIAVLLRPVEALACPEDAPAPISPSSTSRNPASLFRSLPKTPRKPRIS